jgi:HPt (histidine-containing phosphotransfer) domain-containing protein
MDRNEVLARVGGDEKLLRDVVRIFLEDLPTMMEQIRRAVADRDAHNLHQAAHRLKGAVANFSLSGAADAALQLEMMGRSRDLSGVEAALDNLERETASSKETLLELTNP